MELLPDSHNADHKPIAIDLAKQNSRVRRRVPSRSMRDTRHRSLSYTIDNATAPKNENACTCPSTHASAVAARHARTYDASLDVLLTKC